MNLKFLSAFYFLIYLVFSFVNLMAEEFPLGTPEEVARLFDYPGKLVVEDMTDKSKGQGDSDGLLSRHDYSSSDNTFAKISVKVAWPGDSTIEGFRNRLTRALEYQEKHSPMPTMVTKLQLGNGVEGLVGVAGIGPSGQIWCGVASVPQKKVDVMVLLAITGEPSLKETPETAKYHQAMVGEDRNFVINRLTECLRIGVDRIVSGKFAVPLMTKSPQPSLKEPPVTQQSPVASPAQTLTNSDSSSYNWVLVVLIVVAVSLASAIIRKYLHK